ncbi:DDE family transposase [Mucilaginibacter gracilis]|uniref:DDE family transposase n=1 Tax=Mucilaginibacter gracilis TaxID=423350 RepID=A0A495J188_9SPHI|nr:transposase [Mucilaginibacter gracilis]RKR80154.1 DDE family transposase [Mucilaginibacter gracilis]RKR80977.1 DDE family transposase [Mucilaginibacter gracilis]RKR81052.1 DDE family transposase [Mucilaginibacter gracilis]RKR81194.1 DDE family transposase [Mucilaginibacter gracilis]RKR81792.1 DDE family transposase [Mucilaginibacter gracilis]
MSLPSWIQKFKEPKTEIRLIKGTFYKYAVEYRYNSEKKRTDKITLELLGKITEKEGFVPSDKKLIKDKGNSLPVVDIKTYGLYNLFTSLLAEDLPSLLTLFPEPVSQTLLTVAMMRFAYQHPIKRMPFQHAHDYCSLNWVTKGLDDKAITAALKYVGENRELLLGWMKGRLGVREAMQDKFVMIDSTHIPSLSEHLSVNAMGYNPQHSYDPQIRLMYIFSAQMQQPVYYRLINGNITDVTSMKICVDELNIKDVVFIADKGFYSKKNVADLKTASIHFIIPLYRNNNLIDYEPLQQANFKKGIKNYFTYQKRVVWYYEYEKEGLMLTTYLDERLRVEEEADFLTRTQTHPDKYKEVDFFERVDRFGTLTLTNHLPEAVSAQMLYETYKQRNEIEVMFDAYKHFLLADKTYMQNRYVLEGWLMANFIAMIAYYRLYTRLKTANKLSKYAPKDIVEISKSIYQTKIRNTWVRSEITKKTKDLFKSIDIDYLN